MTQKGKNKILIRLIDLWRLIIEIVTLIVGGAFFLFVAVVGLLYTFVKHALIRFDYSLSRQLRPIIRSLTLALDGFSNASAGELLNDWLRPSVAFGKWYYTISATFGLNKLLGQDLRPRKWIDRFFRLFGQKNHCERAVTPEQIVFWAVKRRKK